MSHAAVVNDGVTGLHHAVRPAFGLSQALLFFFSRIDVLCGRFGRNCVYDGRPAQNPRQPGNYAPQIHLDLDNTREALAAEPIMAPLVGDLGTDLGASAGQLLSKDAVDKAVRLQVSRIIGTNLQAIQDVATLFFDSIYVKITFLAKSRFLERLSAGIEGMPADFAALCLCISLILQHPTPGAQSMQSSQYVIVKNTISLLESTGYYLTLDHIQCRLFVIFYEIGHDIFPAASASIGACARMARALGLSNSWHRPISNELGDVVLEEMRRAWWAIYNLDRYVWFDKCLAISDLHVRAYMYAASHFPPLTCHPGSPTFAVQMRCSRLRNHGCKIYSPLRMQGGLKM